MFYARTIKCPRHHLVIPGKLAWQIEENPFTKDTKMSDADCKRFGIRKWKYKRDRYGNKIPDFRNHYQPDVSAAYVLSNVHDSANPICANCKRCLEGFENAHLVGNKRQAGDGRTLQEAVQEMTKKMVKDCS